jgi:predicted dehydrogenase
MSKPVSMALVGVGGYGAMYLSALLDSPQRQGVSLVATVDPAPDRCARRQELQDRGVPHYDDLDALYRRHAVDLTILASPIQLHAEQTILALRHGSHVLCEKPAAATVQDVDRMMAAEAGSGRSVAVGFQWSFTEPIRQLKADILRGDFGKPLRFKSLCLWPRDEVYYSRNDWAGRLRDDEGRWVLDSPVNNAMAHDLHNLLFLLGEAPTTSARPIEVAAEAYRANPIENADTIAARIITDGGTEVQFLGSHTVPADYGPVFSLAFSDAIVVYEADHACIRADFKDGSTRAYASPDATPHERKLWHTLESIADGRPIACCLAAARSHTLCVNGIQDSFGTSVELPRAMIEVAGPPGGRLASSPELAALLTACFQAGALPSERGAPWTRCGRAIDLREYHSYPRYSSE